MYNSSVLETWAHSRKASRHVSSICRSAWLTRATFRGKIFILAIIYPPLK